MNGKKSYLTYHLRFFSIIFSLYIFKLFFIVRNNPNFFVHSTLYTMLVCICNKKFWVLSNFVFLILYPQKITPCLLANRGRWRRPIGKEKIIKKIQPLVPPSLWIRQAATKDGHGPDFFLTGQAGIFHFMYGPDRASPRAQTLRPIFRLQAKT